MKKIFQTKILIIFLVLVYVTLVKCNVKTKSVCRIEEQSINTKINLKPLENVSSDIFPSRDFMIKI